MPDCCPPKAVVLAHHLQQAAEERGCLLGTYKIPPALHEHLAIVTPGSTRARAPARHRLLALHREAPKAQGTDPGVSRTTSPSVAGLAFPPGLEAQCLVRRKALWAFLQYQTRLYKSICCSFALFRWWTIFFPRPRSHVEFFKPCVCLDSKALPFVTPRKQLKSVINASLGAAQASPQPGDGLSTALVPTHRHLPSKTSLNLR